MRGAGSPVGDVKSACDVQDSSDPSTSAKVGSWFMTRCPGGVAITSGMAGTLARVTCLSTGLAVRAPHGR
jgi:hypothetical protein